MVADLEALAEEMDEADIGLDDFYAHLPDYRYILAHTRDLWPAASLDARLKWPEGAQWTADEAEQVAGPAPGSDTDDLGARPADGDRGQGD